MRYSAGSEWTFSRMERWSSTQSARQHKGRYRSWCCKGTGRPRLIRRLTPLECESGSKVFRIIGQTFPTHRTLPGTRRWATAWPFHAWTMSFSALLWCFSPAELGLLLLLRLQLASLLGSVNSYLPLGAVCFAYKIRERSNPWKRKEESLRNDPGRTARQRLWQKRNSLASRLWASMWS